MKKKIRKSIRINGRSITRTFTSKEAAESWYSQLFNKRVMQTSGLALPVRGGVLVKEFVDNEFMPRRTREYPESTWRADEQRINDHVLPAIGNLQIAKVTPQHVRVLLQNLVDQKELSSGTRSRVRAVISSIFNDALNREAGPLVLANPTFGLKFKGKRTGETPPSYLHTTKECVEYLSAAHGLSLKHLVVGALGLMAGLRKQEMIALKWRSIDFVAQAIVVSEKFEQASGEVRAGTKGGTRVERFIPMGDELADVLFAHFQASKHAKPKDFVLANADGSNLSAKAIYTLNAQTCASAGLKVTVHGLRHTFGREFAQRSGNLGALKDILGHTNITVTQRYATLGKGRLAEFRGVVSYGQKGTK